MNLSGEAKALIGIGIASLVIFIGAIFFFSSKDTSTTAENKLEGEKVDQTRLIRPDSHAVMVPDAKVTVVEFLDPECEACGAMYSTVERIREEYKGKISFVVRYFPLHNNSVLAIQALESAGEQGKFWEMYQALFKNQSAWGEKSEPQTELFTSYAQQLGLDMNKFQVGLENNAYKEIADRDKTDGMRVGVNGTPTFFINGVLAGNVMPYEEFKAKIDSELQK